MSESPSHASEPQPGTSTTDPATRDVISIAITRELMQYVKHAVVEQLEQGKSIQYRQIGEMALRTFLATPEDVTTRRLQGPTTRIEISRALLREVKAYAVMQQANGGSVTNQCGVLDHALRRYLQVIDQRDQVVAET